MAENKNCKRCEEKFVVESEDLALYEKISPNVNGNVYKIPSTSLCPDCRMRRHLAWRNERHLYKRKCDNCQKEIVSIYSPDKQYKIFCQKCFWSDDWDGLATGIEFDASKTFFENYKALQSVAPRISLLSKKSENSEYTNHASDNKNCYLSFISFNNENVLYSRKVFKSRDVLDSFFVIDKGEKLHNCFWVSNAYSCTNIINGSTVRDCHYCIDLKNCSDCFMSSNLRGKRFVFRNKQLSQEEYEKQIKEILSGSYDKSKTLEKEFEEVKRSAVYKYAQIQNCENTVGDYVEQCKDVYHSFISSDGENMRYCSDFDNSGYGECRDCIDSCCFGSSELLCEVHSQASGYHNIATNYSYEISESMYCDNCHNCKNCFGCIGLKQKEYCILNKQFTKDEYYKKVVEIIEKMIQENEWGEFFPMSLSPFGYNETMAHDMFPMTKDEAQVQGLKWQDNDYTPAFQGKYYEPDDNINAYKDNKKQEEILNGVMKCGVSERPFKIVPNELAFYLENNIPIPRKHYEERFKEKFKILNPFKFYHRQCMCEEAGHGHDGRCKVEFETTYAPDRPEKVYCEGCYQQSVI